MMLDGLEDAYEAGRSMGTFGEDCAAKYSLTRAEQDAFATASVQRARRRVYLSVLTSIAAAWRSGAPRSWRRSGVYPRRARQGPGGGWVEGVCIAGRRGVRACPAGSAGATPARTGEVRQCAKGEEAQEGEGRRLRCALQL
jgi:hypothetical protein